jgi:membrane-bound ClpP family serine protease
MDAALVPWIFAAIMAGGVTFLLISIFLGDFADLDADVDVDIGGIDVDGALDGLVGDIVGDADVAEGRNLGCMVIAAFLTGFGAMGLLGSLAEWSVLVSVLAGLAFGLIFGRSTAAVLRFVVRQESTDLLTTDKLVGAFARITINTPAGRIGEAIVEGESLIKYPVKAVSDDVELKKGDYVEIVEVRQGRLYVKKKRSE